ncbi:MAG: DUF4340 domain-containing protein [Acidobacteriota bacterium]|nr:DUF4340 domain-containing protein [Acidobacteriota bacterium]
MRGARSFLLLALVAAGIGGYVWFVEMKRDSSSEETPREKLFAVDTSQIHEVRLRNEAGETSTLKKAGDRWTLAEVEGASVDDTELSNITSGLASLELQRVVDEQPASLAEYGLDTPRFTVAFTDAAGKSHTLLLGSKTPMGGDLYAKLPDAPRVFLVGGFLEESFNRSRFDLRDKAILKFAREAVSGVELSAGSSRISLVRRGGNWHMSAPSDEPADDTVVEGLIDRLATARMQSIVDDAGAAAAALAKPSAAVGITAGPTRAQLEIGGAAGEGTVYARDTVRNIVFTIEAPLAAELAKKAEDFRKKAQ